jgi:hypothetical protein
VPLTQAAGSFLRLVPGQRPMLVYKQLEDYWYEPPSDPSGYWTSHFDIRVVRSEEDARKLSGVGPRWVAIGEGAGAAARLGAVAAKDGAGKAGTGAKINDATVLAHLDYFRATKTRYEIHCMRARSSWPYAVIRLSRPRSGPACRSSSCTRSIAPRRSNARRSCRTRASSR